MSLPPNEIQRLAELSEYEILDTPTERLYDGLVHLASLIAETPMAVLSFMAQDRQWFKGKVGVEIGETCRDVAFCACTINSSAPLIVEDARLDAEFSQNPYVAGEPHLVFYAGFPLITPQGFPIGTLCVMDTKPRRLTEAQIGGIKELASQAMAHLESRRVQRKLATAVRARQQTVEQHARLVAFLDKAPLVAFVKDSSERYLYVNEAFERVHNLRREDVLGLEDEVVFPSEIAAQNRIEDESTREQQRMITCYDTRQDGVWLTHRFPVENGVGGISVDIGAQRAFERQVEQYLTDLSDARIGLELRQRELQEANEKLEQLAVTDGLTGLLNHRALQERLDLEMAKSRRSGKPVSFVLMDLDHFKDYNDAFGHPAGDDVLRQVAGTLHAMLRPTDVVARYGGEELALILPGTDAAGLAVVTERVREAIANCPWPLQPVTVSIGAATYDAHSDDKATLIKRADDALYQAKADGRDRVCLAA